MRRKCGGMHHLPSHSRWRSLPMRYPPAVSAAAWSPPADGLAVGYSNEPVQTASSSTRLCSYLMMSPSLQVATATLPLAVEWDTG